CRRLLAACTAFLAVSSATLAQTTSDQQANDTRGDQPVIMSKFEVSSTQGKGYTSSNAATGFKTNESLLQIPQAVTLVTRDLIDDIGAVESSNILQYAGVSNFFTGESFAMRGTRIGYPLLDEMPDGAPYLDNVNLDSYTVLRGPAATLYLNASLGGTVLTTSKIPLTRPQYSLTVRANEHGMRRVEGDFTGPLGSIGDMKFSYRIVAAQQEGDTAFKNMTDDRKIYHPTLQMVYKNTVVRIAYDYQQLDHIPNANSFVTPTGKLYTGAGRDEAYFARNAMENFHRRGVRFVLIQKLSDNWDLKVAATRWWFSRLGSIVFPSGGINWVNQTMTIGARKNDQKLDFSIAQVDVNGKHTFGRITAQTTFGASYSDEVGKNRILGFPAGVFPTRIIPINNPGLDNIFAPPLSSFSAVNPGSQSTTYRGNAYIQETVNVIPERLTLVAGFTHSKIKINNITNTAANVFGIPVNGSDNLHRYGAVFNITKEAVIYAMESTTFAPTSARDVNLNILPSAVGKGQEVGFKTAFFDGRISSTFSIYKLELTNQSFFAGVRPDGISYLAPIGSTSQKGYDFDLAYSPVPGLQFIGTYYHGKVKDQAGNDVANSYTGQVSLVGRYEVQSGSMKGFSFGAGYVRISGRKLATGAYVTGITPNPAFIVPEPGDLVNIFASYKINNHWFVRGNVDNALDEAYALGAQNAYFVDPSPPRTISLSATYRF
ncbi:MAG: TonB-dependent receptor plug domain-containing protein, partial [Opitutus sp.]